MKLKIYFPLAIAFGGMVLGAWVLISPASAKTKGCPVCHPPRPYCCLQNNTCQAFPCE